MSFGRLARQMDLNCKFMDMKQHYPIVKRLMLLLSGFLGDGVLYSQGQIPNGEFEAWTTPPFASYEEPNGGWWTTLNTLKSIGGPETVQKTTDVHGGNFAAVLTTKQWGTLTIPGLLVSGEFDIQNPSFLVQGQPFTDLPQAFQGWFKYSPVGGDSAGLAALLTRWNSNLQKRDTLAQAAWVVTSAYPSWAAFDLPFAYFQTGISPDSILVAMVSSGDGQNFKGQVGSTLWIDDVRLEYPTSRPALEVAPQISVAFRGHQLFLDLPENLGASVVRVFDMRGQLLMQVNVKGGEQRIDFDPADGIYLVEISACNGIHLRQKLVCLRP